MRRLIRLLLQLSTPLLLIMALLILTATVIGPYLPSNALLYMTGPDRFVLRDWPHQLDISFNLNTGLRQQYIEDFQWMPDGQRFVFNRDFGGESYESYLYDIFSRQTIPIVMNTTDHRLPVWTAATRSWAWVSDSELICVTIGLNASLNCKNFEGPQYLTWSPDGQHLAFFEELRSRLLVLNVMSGEVTILDTGAEPLNAVPLTWTPDSRSLAFLQTNSPSLSNSAMRPVNSLIEFYQVEGRWQPAVRSPVTQQYPSDIAYTIDHTWSPDGSQFAFSAVQSIREQNLNELYIFFRDSNTMQQLTSNLSQEIHPRWPTDNTWFAYLENANGYPYLVVRSAAAGYRDSMVLPIYGFNLDWRP
jgi:Tol biopolymer transport system component